jgi:hypothetical protein
MTPPGVVPNSAQGLSDWPTENISAALAEGHKSKISPINNSAGAIV